MKKLVAFVIISSIAIVALITLAFIYIDVSGHKGFTYELFVGGKPFASVKVNRYATEGKVIYKSREESSHSLGYPVVSKKLFLEKGSLLPLKYTEEAGRGKGALRSIFLVQDGERTDYLSPPLSL